MLVTRRAAFFTMWRGMLGDFDVDILQRSSSILMFVFFQFIVVVLMMNLIIAIMGDSYEAVKENETTEALHERAKIIVDMELLCEYFLPIMGYIVKRESAPALYRSTRVPFHGFPQVRALPAHLDTGGG